MEISKAHHITCGGQVKNGVSPLFAVFEELDEFQTSIKEQ